MVQKPPPPTHTLDIAGLLDLLNNSGADDTSDTQPPAETTSAPPDPAPPDLIDSRSLPEVTSTTAKPLDLPVYPENSDNRFAAHIVFGLSKLRRS
jgi:hypothetical protein